jgi:hypothetical protein
MKNVGVLSLTSTGEGSHWIRHYERDPNEDEFKKSNGLFWTCNVTKENPQMVLRKFEDKIWYLFKKQHGKDAWVMDFYFTHWLCQHLEIPQVSHKERELMNDHMNYLALTAYRSRLTYNI